MTENFLNLQSDQPLSLQDEINMSEEYVEIAEEQQEQQPETSHFRQIFAKLFNLLQSTHVNENVT